MINWTIEGDPILCDVDYDGLQFTVIDDASRDKWGGGRRGYTYAHLYEGKRWCNGDERLEYTAILTNAETFTEELFKKSPKDIFIIYQDH